MATGGTTQGMEPVFIKTQDIPDSGTVVPTVIEVCEAAEDVSGKHTIVGAQNIRSLWRIYPKTNQVRQTLLSRGISIRGVVLQVLDKNPFIVKDQNGREKPYTKLWVDYIPISVSNEEIEEALVRIGCELRSKAVEERARNRDGKLTHFLTGRRYVFITVPQNPIAKKLEIADQFTASIYHKEMRSARKTPVCSKCLRVGHHQSTCNSEIICRACKNPGHRRGDPECPIFNENEQPADPTEQNESAESAETTDPTESYESYDLPRRRSSMDRSRRYQRNRTAATENRHRSGTPKRSRSSGQSSPGTKHSAAKLQKTNNASSKGPVSQRSNTLYNYVNQETNIMNGTEKNSKDSNDAEDKNSEKT